MSFITWEHFDSPKTLFPYCNQSLNSNERVKWLELQPSRSHDAVRRRLVPGRHAGPRSSRRWHRAVTHCGAPRFGLTPPAALPGPARPRRARTTRHPRPETGKRPRLCEKARFHTVWPAISIPAPVTVAASGPHYPPRSVAHCAATFPIGRPKAPVCDRLAPLLASGHQPIVAPIECRSISTIACLRPLPHRSLP